MVRFPGLNTERFYAVVKNLTASFIGRIKIRKNGKIVEPSIIALSRVGIEKKFSQGRVGNNTKNLEKYPGILV